MRYRPLSLLWIALLSLRVADRGPAVLAQVHSAPEATAAGKLITPMAATGAIFQELNPNLPGTPNRRAGYAGTVALSPNGQILAIQTSGFSAYFDDDGKLLPDASTEYVFLYDVTSKVPKQIQVLMPANTFPGLAWTPASDRIYVSGGKDDTVIEYVSAGSKWVAGRTIHLGHTVCLGARPIDADCGPVTGGLAVSPDGSRLLVANIQNDSVSLIDLTTGKVTAERDLRPGVVDPRRRGVSGGGFPRSVAWISADRAYVSSVRDREVIALHIERDRIRVGRRLHVQGAPAALLANRKGSRLYVALDTSGQVAVFDTRSNRLIEAINAVAPTSVYDDRKLLAGANTNALALMPDERTLLVSNGGQNSVAVIRLGDRAMDPAVIARDTHRRPTSERDTDDDEDADRPSLTMGLVPTGDYPTGVATSHDGSTWYIVNGKSPLGSNSGWCQTKIDTFCAPGVEFGGGEPKFGGNYGPSLVAKNMYVDQLERAGFLSMPAPDGLELARLTKQVAHNNRFDQPEQSEADARLFSFLRDHIKHVVYIMKENRTYDQILGDLEIGNGDPRLALFPERISPNHHAIARNFVTLDNVLVSAEGSMTGVYWAFSGQSTDLLERTDPMTLGAFYRGETGGFPYGANRNVNIVYPTSKERRAADPAYPNDPDISPGTHSVYDVDGPGGEAGAGYLWNGALRARLSVRGYGVYARLSGAAINGPFGPKPEVFASDGGTVSPQSIAAYEDPNWPLPEWIKAVPDFYRVREWQREFKEFSQKGSAPSLMVMYLWEDHFGHFDTEMDGVNTPDTQMADNDYSVGELVESVANSIFAKDTLVIVIEDDTTDGPDHVNAERTVTLFAGPYVRQHAVVPKRYTTVNVVRTIEDVLGIQPANLNDALAAPMSDVFDPKQATWTYKAIVPDVLRSTQLPLPPDPRAHVAYPRHSAAYWQKAMAGQDFSAPDRIDASFSRALWRGLKGTAPYPKPPSWSADDH